MKIFGTISELVAAVFRKNSQAVTFRPNQATTYTASRDIQMPAGDTDHVLVSRTSTDTLTNKTLTSPTLTAPTSTDGSFTSVDTFSLDDTNSAFNTVLQSTSSNSANRTLTISVEDGNRILQLEGDLVKASSHSLTLTTSANTNVNFPPAGSGTLATTANTETFSNKTLGNTNTVTLKDTLFTLQDDGDTSKQLRMQLSGITTATTRTLTAPDANTTIVGTDATQTLSNKVIGNSNSATLIDSTGLLLQDSGDNTKQQKFDVPAGQTTATTLTQTLPTTSGVLANDNNSISLTNKSLDDNSTVFYDNSDVSKGFRLEVPAAQTTGTTRLHTLPAVSSTLASLTGTETFSNKTVDNSNTVTLKDSLFTIQDDGDTTKQAKFQASGITTGTTRTYTLPDASGTLLTSTQATFADNAFTLQDDGDPTKQLQFQVSGVTTGTTRTLTAPNANTTIVGTDATQTLSNKTIDTSLPVNSTATTANSFIEFKQGGVTKGYYGVQGSSGGLVNGAGTSDVVEISNGNQIVFSADTGTTIGGKLTSAHAWTLGTSGGTQTHTVNGNLSITGTMSAAGSPSRVTAGPVKAAQPRGSSNTNVVNYGTNQTTVGTDITYAASDANGSSFTINTTGIYAINATHYGAAALDIGITKTQTADPSTLTFGTQVLAFTDSSAGVPADLGGVFYLASGDIVRLNTTNSNGNTSNFNGFFIVKIS